MPGLLASPTAGVGRLQRGDRLVAFQDRPLREWLFIEVNRVAKDGTWADLSVLTWAVMWKKRQKLDERGLPPQAEMFEWDDSHLDRQMAAHTEFLDARR